MGWASDGAKCLRGAGCLCVQATEGEEDPALVLLPRVVMGGWRGLAGNVGSRVEGEGWKMKENGE